jgi:hypothetical protein
MFAARTCTAWCARWGYQAGKQSGIYIKNYEGHVIFSNFSFLLFQLLWVKYWHSCTSWWQRCGLYGFCGTLFIVHLKPLRRSLPSRTFIAVTMWENACIKRKSLSEKSRIAWHQPTKNIWLMARSYLIKTAVKNVQNPKSGYRLLNPGICFSLWVSGFLVCFIYLGCRSKNRIKFSRHVGFLVIVTTDKQLLSLKILKVSILVGHNNSWNPASGKASHGNW